MSLRWARSYSGLPEEDSVRITRSSLREDLILVYANMRDAYHPVMRGPRGGGAGVPVPLNNPKDLGLLSNTCSGLKYNHNAAKPDSNGGTSSTRQRNAI